jgi:hypothetical protein
MGGGGSKVSNFCTNIVGVNHPNFSKAVFDQNNNVVDLSTGDPFSIARVDNIMNIAFNTNLSQLLGLANQSVTINMNPFRNPLTSPQYTDSLPKMTNTLVTYSTNMPVLPSLIPLPTLTVVASAVFPLTNTSNIQIQSLSVLNYTDGIQVTLSTQTLNPMDVVTVTVDDVSDILDVSGSVTAFPILFVDNASGWQNNLSSPDYPVLGGFVAARGIDWTASNPYGSTAYSSGQFFSNYQNDTPPVLGESFQGTLSSLGISYYANQNVYSEGEAVGQNTLSQLFITSIV